MIDVETPAPAGSPDTTEGGQSNPSGRLSPRVRSVMAGVLGLLIAVAVVAIVLEAAVLKPRYDEARSETRARADVVRVAQQFTAQVNDYDPGTAQSYQTRVKPLLTTKFRGEFEKVMTDLVSQIDQAKMRSKGTIKASAVSSLDQDSAQVLVVADADVTTVFDSRQRHFRWDVSLVKVDGRWLVDDFSPVD